MVNNIGSAIRKRRLELNLTQEDLAELSDISVNFLSQLERTNNQNISIKKIDSIAAALNFSTPELIEKAYGTNHKINENSVININNKYFLNKLIAELRKLPENTAEQISKHLYYVIKDLDSKKDTHQ